MNLTLAYLPNDMAVLRNAGESSGLSYRCSSWLVAYLLASLHFLKTGKNKKMIRRSLFPLEGVLRETASLGARENIGIRGF
jgi:hypothetical protein